MTYGRTRSNHLVSLLGSHPSIACTGEIASYSNYKNQINYFKRLGKDHPELLSKYIKYSGDIKKNPIEYIETCYDLMSTKYDLVGFKIFYEHDKEIMGHLLRDPSVKKIILVRNYLYSFLSEVAAYKTGVWLIENGESSKTTKIDFDLDLFLRYVSRKTQYLNNVVDQLEESGQKYLISLSEDIASEEWWRRVTEFLEIPPFFLKDSGLQVQNPKYLEDRINNYNEIVRLLMNSRYSILTYGDFFPDRNNWLLNSNSGQKQALFNQQEELLELKIQILKKIKEKKRILSSKQWRAGNSIVSSNDRLFGWLPYYNSKKSKR